MTSRNLRFSGSTHFLAKGFLETVNLQLACRRHFSRKGAKKTLRNAIALCAFAPLRESLLVIPSTLSRIKSLEIDTSNYCFAIAGRPRSIYFCTFPVAVLGNYGRNVTP